MPETGFDIVRKTVRRLAAEARDGLRGTSPAFKSTRTEIIDAREDSVLTFLDYLETREKQNG